jgi:hypothetical protein
MDDERWKWGKAMLACIAEVKARQTSSCVFTDQEVMPRFDGRPDDMFVWFICRTKAEKEKFKRSRLGKNNEVLKDRMARANFPAQAIESLGTDVTSEEDIQAGGGRFFFFR